jgi:hypothetical protein
MNETERDLAVVRGLAVDALARTRRREHRSETDAAFAAQLTRKPEPGLELLEAAE